MTKDNIEIMINDKGDEGIKQLTESPLSKYQLGLEAMKGSNFIFNCVDLLNYKCQIIYRFS